MSRGEEVVIKREIYTEERPGVLETVSEDVPLIRTGLDEVKPSATRPSK